MAIRPAEPGQLRHVVTLQDPERTPASRGQRPQTWTDLVTLRAAIDPLRGRELEAARQLYGAATHKVTIRHYPNVSPEHRLQIAKTTARQLTAASSQYFNTADTAALSLGADTDFTFGCWVYPDSETRGAIVSQYAISSSQAAYNLGIDPSNATSGKNWTLQVSPDGTSGAATLLIGAEANQRRWNFVLGWHDSATDQIVLQANDGREFSAAHTGGTFDSSADVLIGADETLAGPADTNHFDGRLSQLVYWQRTLTAAERTWLYNGGIRERTKADLDAHATLGDYTEGWALNESSGNAASFTGNHDATANASPGSAAGPSVRHLNIGSVLNWRERDEWLVLVCGELLA